MGFPLPHDESDRIEAMILAPPELIVVAAIKVGDVVVVVERPGRHGNCINFLHALGQDYAEQGFLTSHGRFVGRTEAVKVAFMAEQATPSERCPHRLFSEDVWTDLPLPGRGGSPLRASSAERQPSPRETLNTPTQTQAGKEE